MKKKKIIACALATLLMSSAGCGTLPETSAPIFDEAQPVAVATARPAPQSTPIPDRPILEGTDLLVTALANLGIDIDPKKDQTVEELVVFMVKLFGQEEEALKRNYQHPYSDVSAEASPYVGYAYATWLLTGKPGDTLGAEEEADETLLVSMLMRGMGYSESENGEASAGGDMTELAAELGIAPPKAGAPLRGDDLAHILWAALEAENNEGETLAKQLIEEDVFSRSDYRESGYLSRGETPPEPEHHRSQTQDVPTIVTNPMTTAIDSGSSSGGSSSSSGGGSSGGGSSGGESGPSGGGGESGPVTGGDASTDSTETLPIG